MKTWPRRISAPSSSAATERVDAAGDSPWAAEHRSRYLWAARFVEDKVVLDVACGTGYGLSILASAGPRLAVGMDRTLTALPRRAPSGSALLCGDAGKLPFVSGSADFVVSFETVEHLEDPEAFFREVARVLKPKGRVAISSPNGEFSPRGPGGRHANPFHVKEFLPSELTAMLAEHLDDVRVYGQIVPRSFGVCPFWEPPHRLRGSFGTQVKSLVWKSLVRLPPQVGRVFSRRLLKQTLYPEEHDFAFVEGESHNAHVFVITGQVRPREGSPSGPEEVS